MIIRELYFTDVTNALAILNAPESDHSSLWCGWVVRAYDNYL